MSLGNSMDTITEAAASDAETYGLALLRQPFPAHQISKLPKPFKKDSPKGKCGECGGFHGLPAMHLDYVGHAALTDRLLDADPRWTWEPVTDPRSLGLPVAEGGMWIRLTVCGVTRLGFGSADGKSGGDAVKEMIGDALRNAGMRFGAALDLWHKGQLHDDGDDDAPTARNQVELPPARNVKPPAVKPEKYDEFTVDYIATADNGLDALRKAYKDAPQAMKDYLTKHDEKTYNAARSRAEAVSKAAKGAAA